MWEAGNSFYWRPEKSKCFLPPDSCQRSGHGLSNPLIYSSGSSVDSKKMKEQLIINSLHSVQEAAGVIAQSFGAGVLSSVEQRGTIYPVG